MRESKDLSWHKLAALAGVGPRFVYDLERGKPNYAAAGFVATFSDKVLGPAAHRRGMLAVDDIRRTM